VTITVNPINDAPVAGADSATVAEGGTVTVLDSTETSVLANDTDPEGDTLTAVLVSDVSHGSLTLNGNGTFTYTHDGTENFTDSFTYKANDNQLDSNTVAVSITITAVNDAPVATDDSYTVDEDTTLTVTTPGVLGNDFDVDPTADTLTATLVDDVSNGSLTPTVMTVLLITPTMAQPTVTWRL
jgi:VCBS repeat-containing protein